jgi:adenine-specific DNA-methyltransferase
MQKRKSKEPGGLTLSALKHPEDTRMNIPTVELESFASDEVKKAPPLLYKRDPSLDPQLVWKGKDEQDQSDLAIPSLPIYIQEKIAPQALIEDLRAVGRKASEPQIDLFGDFNGIEFEKLVDFYHHEQHWTNRAILGDSLRVMASLSEREGLKGKVQLVYMDPPYGIAFGSNWQVSTKRRVVRDGPDDVTLQPEQIRAFRDTWEYGVSSYLSYLRDRLTVARDLLTPTGSVCVQIGDENLHLVRSVMDEVFGSQNAHPVIAFRKKMMPMMKDPGFESVCDFILWYQMNKDASVSTLNALFSVKSIEGDPSWAWVELPDRERRRMTTEERNNHALLPRGSRVFQPISMLPREYRKNQDFVFELDGVAYPPPKNECWSTDRPGMGRLALAKRLIPSGDTLRYIYYVDDYPVSRIVSTWTDTAPPSDMTYVVETTPKVMERIILACTNPGDLVLDPTCGSGTSSVVAEQWGRRWITIDTSRVALALARTRLMSAIFPYYVLRDSPKGVEKESEVTGIAATAATLSNTHDDLRKGFVYSRVPHIKLGSIAQNPDIKPEMDREEIEKAITRHAETELLFDRPIKDERVIRVTGPFTVESLSPYQARAIGSDIEAAPVTDGESGYVERVLDNLRAAGVQNTKAGQRLDLHTLEIWPGKYVNALGTYKNGDKTERVAICIGPESGTIGSDMVREAAKEALDVADVLIVCGFAFDATVAEEATRLGRLTILKARMNTDLQMGNKLLRKTSAANLFMVFGEPDLDVITNDDGTISIEIRGLDVYDPSTKEVRPSSTDEIACWFIDTNYNAESFFVRHAYFLGVGDPYKSLARALKADVDALAWKSLYSARSRPFRKPETGKIAIKIVNHYGDEVLKVYQVT